MDTVLLTAFIPTFFFVSITPGLCMTLALTLGMTIGLRQTLWMMLGELAGVALVASCAVLGVAGLMLNYPQVFAVFKWVGGAYLIWIGIQMWRSKGKMSFQFDSEQLKPKPVKLISQGFITAIANPKGWAFMIALLPPFISPAKPMPQQMVLLIGIILTTEFISMLAYATGGKSLRHLLSQSGNVQLLNRIAAILMIFVGFWLALG